MDINEIKDELSKSLKKSRYNHSLGVGYISAALAMRYKTDWQKAYLAGLIHDCAKAYDSDKYIEMAREYNIEISESEINNPQLLHAKLGAYFARKKFGIDDTEICNAIIYHTTGRPAMTLLEKIVYVADYIEPGRDKANRLKQIREMAFSDIDTAIFMIAEDTVNYLKTDNKYIDSITVDTYNYYKKEA